MSDKHYKNIKEVSKILNLKEHVIRHWDSIDPKTQKLRIQGLSIRSKGGTRYFNKENIKKLEQIKNLLFENGKHNYSLDLANKILSSRKNKVLKFKELDTSTNEKNHLNRRLDKETTKLDIILNKLRNLSE